MTKCDKAADSSAHHPSIDPLSRAEAFLARRRGLVIATIVAVSVLLRTAYFFQLQDDACLHQHQWVSTDMHFNDAWAKEINASGWLLNQPFHPFFDWNRDMVTKLLLAHPEKASELRGTWSGAGPPPAAEKLLWDEWYGGKRFHQEPLYPYLLALTYRLFGEDVRPIFVLQMLVGVWGNLLVYLIARRYFGDLVGSIAGAMATLCGPILYYELILLRDSLFAVAGLAAVYMTQRALDTSIWPRWLAAGLGSGLALLLKSSFALFLVWVLAGMVWAQRKQPGKLAVNLGAWVCGVALLLAPAVHRNMVVGAPPLSLSSVGAITFVGANTADYGSAPDFVGGFFVSPRYAADIMAASGGKFLPAALAALGTHERLGTYLRQLWLKTSIAFHWYEVPNNSNFYYYRLHASVLRFLPVTFGLIAPLALVGLILAARNRPRPWLMYALMGCSLLLLLGFGVFSRLRLTLFAASIVFAALSLATAARWVSGRQWLKLAVLGAALVPLALWVGRPLPDSVPLIRPIDYMAPVFSYYAPQAQAADARGDPCAAAARWADALGYEPAFIGALDATRPATSASQKQLAGLFGQSRYFYVVSLQSCRDQATGQTLKETLELEISRQQLRLKQLAAAVSPPT